MFYYKLMKSFHIKAADLQMLKNKIKIIKLTVKMNKLCPVEKSIFTDPLIK